MATHSNVLAWRIPGTGEPGGLPSLRLHSWTWLSDWTDWGVERNWWKRRTSLSFIFLLTPILSVQSEVKWVKVTFLPRKRKVKVAQSCLTLCNRMDCTVHGILQAIILEWVAAPFSRGSSQPRDGSQVSLITGRFFTNWAIREAPKCPDVPTETRTNWCQLTMARQSQDNGFILGLDLF